MAKLSNINVSSVMMRLEPNESAEASNELLYGEAISILEETDDWIKVQAQHDGYEGFIPSNTIKTHQDKTHKVSVPVTHLYDAPDFKSPHKQPLYFLSPVHASDEKQNGFVKLANGRWVFGEHLCALSKTTDNFVETALKFLDTPYLWGGRSCAGIDCSGLVQISLMAAGVKALRDTKDQITSIGTEHSSAPERGDLVFFKGHVGIMIDGEQLLNATSRHMKTVIEPLAAVEDSYDGILSIKRL